MHKINPKYRGLLQLSLNEGQLSANQKFGSLITYQVAETWTVLYQNILLWRQEQILGHIIQHTQMMIGDDHLKKRA